MSSHWKDVLKKQQDDLDMLEAMDKEMSLNQQEASLEADRVLKRSTTFGVSFGAGNISASASASSGAAKAAGASKRNGAIASARANELDLDLGELALGADAADAGMMESPSADTPNSSSSPKRGSLSARSLNTKESKSASSSSSRSTKISSSSTTAASSNAGSTKKSAAGGGASRPLSSSSANRSAARGTSSRSTAEAEAAAEDEVGFEPNASVTSELASPSGSSIPTPAGAPDTALRFQKAKLSQVQKTLQDSEELRRKLQEQNADLQRTLKSEREESKKMRKQIQVLEMDMRKDSRRPSVGGGGGGGGGGSSSSSADPVVLLQELAILRKDLQTAERLAKTAEANSVAKEAIAKRAVEAAQRLKTQLSDVKSSENASSSDDKSRADAAEQRCKALEKQRADLVTAFKKQMKYIDILKRQKLHVEAARLLSFTEEEFVKTLDWSP